MLVDRDAELASIASALESATGGRGRLVVLEGPAGCGKTALLQAAVRRARGWRTCRAAGGEFERTAAFGVVRELLSRAADEAALHGAATHAAPLFGGGAAGAAADAATLRHGLYWFVADLAADGPVLLVVDDLQWADDESMRFVAYLAARVDELPVALVTAWRSGEPASDETALDRLGALPTATVLHPGPLKREGALQLLRAAIGEHADPQLAGQLHEASAGNPFLLRELIGALRRGGAETLPATPERVVRALRTRLDRLPPAARALANAVAVLGRGTPIGAVAALADLRADEIAAPLDALVAADVLRAERPLDFVHPLVRHALYDALPSARRSAAHARAARILAARHADAEEVGRHLLQSDATDRWTVESLIEAVQLALRRGGPGEAVLYARRALATPPPSDMLPAVLEALGDAEVWVSDLRGLERYEQAIAGTDNPGKRLALAVKRAGAAMGTARLGAGELADLSAAIEADAHADPAAAASALSLVLGGNINILAPGHADAAARADTMRRSLPPGQSRRILAGFLAGHGMIAGAASARVRELALEAIGDNAQAAELLEPRLRLSVAVEALAFAGEVELALHRHHEELATVRAWHAPWPLFRCLVEGSRITALAGDLRSAEVKALEALELLGAVRTPMRAVFSALALADALVDRDPRRALELIEVLGLSGDVPDVGPKPAFIVARARLHLALGHPEQSIRDAETASALMAAIRFDSPAWAPATEVTAEALVAVGRREQASRTAAQALAAAERFGAPAPIARCLHVAARAAPASARLDALQRAVPLLAACGQPVAHARGLLDLGAELRRGRRRADAREPLLAARELAERHGAQHLADHALVELRAAGARPRRIMRSGVEALTPSELRIAQMAADQQRNRTIAELLFVSQRTVETHLRNAYRKLDISSRDELRVALQRQQ